MAAHDRRLAGRQRRRFLQHRGRHRQLADVVKARRFFEERHLGDVQAQFRGNRERVTHDAFAVSKGVLEGFAAQTGINVKVLQAGDAGAMVNQAILTKGKPLGDVLYGVDNTFLTRAVDAGIFEPYTSPGLNDVDPQFSDQTASGAVTPIDFGDVALNHHKAYLGKHR
jgi:ABC-type thiamine transport system substrate-binding protein